MRSNSYSDYWNCIVGQFRLSKTFSSFSPLWLSFRYGWPIYSNRMEVDGRASSCVIIRVWRVGEGSSCHVWLWLDRSFVRREFVLIFLNRTTTFNDGCPRPVQSKEKQNFKYYHHEMKDSIWIEDVPAQVHRWGDLASFAFRNHVQVKMRRNYNKMDNSWLNYFNNYDSKFF